MVAPDAAHLLNKRKDTFVDRSPHTGELTDELTCSRAYLSLLLYLKS